MKDNLPVRKRLRLKKFDYSKEEIYFITICIKNRIELLGKIIETNRIELTKIGNISEQYIKKIEIKYKNVKIDEYIIMPNHIYLLLIVNKQNDISISRIIKQYKMCVSKIIGYSIWQKSFYEHIIRNEKEYWKIKEYIKDNIINWKKDKYF